MTVEVTTEDSTVEVTVDNSTVEVAVENNEVSVDVTTGGGIGRIVDASDTDFSGLGDLDVLQYDLATGKWKNNKNGIFKSGIADGAAAKAFTLTSNNSMGTDGAKVLSVVDDATERFYIGKTAGVNHSHFPDSVSIRDFVPSSAATALGIDTTFVTTGISQTAIALELSAKVQNDHNVASAFGAYITVETTGSGQWAQPVGMQLTASHSGTEDLVGMKGIQCTLSTIAGTTHGCSGAAACIDIDTDFLGNGTWANVIGINIDDIGDSNITAAVGLKINKITGATSKNVGLQLAGDGAGADIVFGDSSIGYSSIQGQGDYLELIADRQSLGGRWVQTTGAHSVTSWLHVNGDLTHGGSKLGFYGATSVVQASAMTAADATPPSGTDATIIANLQTRVNELDAMLNSTTGIGIAA